MIDIFNIMRITGICPILASCGEDRAAPAAMALVRGGVPMVEVLLRDQNSLQNLETIAKQVPQIAVGAGTVVTVSQAEEAVGRGAQFIVQPGMSRRVVEYCLSRNIPVIPGCVTPAEITAAAEYGLSVVKFFPVYQLGGAAMLEQLAGPFPSIEYMVTGALNRGNFLPLLKCPKVIAAGGDWMFADGGALESGDYALISKNLRGSVCEVQDLHNAMTMK